MKNPFERAGLNLHVANSIKAATEWLEQQREKLADTAVLIKPNQAIDYDFPAEHEEDHPQAHPPIKKIGHLAVFERGEEFIRQARETGMLPASVMVYLVDREKHHQIPQGFNGTFQLTDNNSDYDHLINKLTRPKRLAAQAK